MDTSNFSESAGWQPGVTPTPAAVEISDALDGLFDADRGTDRILQLLADPSVQDVRLNRHDRIFYTDATGTKMVGDRIFAGAAQYIATVDKLLRLTDVGHRSCEGSGVSVIEGSFVASLTNIRGSVIVATSEITRGEPAVVVRKQPRGIVTLDQMLDAGACSADMALFLSLAARGRLNMIIAGASGAGKTTLMRALSFFVDPSQRIVTVEEIDELNLADRLPNTVALTTFRQADETGLVRRQETLEDLVRHALRMRADRIWVGETRGREADALVKACLSGHDGSLTSLHASSAAQAVRQIISYMMESHMTEEVAREQVANAFHLAVFCSRVRMGRRVIAEITELEPAREGTQQRKNELWRWDWSDESFVRVGTPSARLREAMERANVNLSELDALLDSANRRSRR